MKTKEKTPIPEEKKPENEFDLRKALNNANFIKFLEGYPDVKEKQIDLEEQDVAEMKTRFEVFEVKQNVVKELRDLFMTQVSKDIGMKLDRTALDSIDAFIAKQTIENPAEVHNLFRQALEFKVSQKSMAALEQEFKKLGGVEKLKEAKKNFKEVEKTRGFFNVKNSPLVGWLFRTKSEKQARKTVKQEYGMEFDEISKALESIESFEEARKVLKEAKTALFENFEPAQIIFEKARNQAQARLHELANPKKGLASLDQARRYYESLKGEHGEMSIDYLETLKDENEFVEKLDRAIDGAIVAKIDEKIKKPTGSRPLDNLEASLKEIVTREQIGSKKGGEAKDFVKSSLEERMKAEADPAKVMLMKFILRNL